MFRPKFTLVSLLLLTTVAANAQFQRLRLTSGIFKVAGDVSSQIPAACIDLPRKTPQATDSFNAFSGAVWLTRTKDRKTEKLPFS